MASRCCNLALSSETMGKIVEKNRPCLSCKSSDARQVYEDGTSFCFACNKFFSALIEAAPSAEVAKPHKKEESFTRSVSVETIDTYISRGFQERLISKAVCEFYGVKVSYNEDGDIDTHYYPYRAGDSVAYKVRKLPKTFTWVGKSGGLFGQSLFQKGGKRVVITEGEIDALSVAQAYYSKYKTVYPVVAVPSSTGTAQLLANRDWLRSFKEIILCFDEDEAGRGAVDEAIKILGIDKVKITKLPVKDANEQLITNGGQQLLSCIYDAATWSPAGIIKKEALWNALATYNEAVALPYPHCLKGVNGKVKGARLGEIALFISGTGSGKSSIFREIMYDFVVHQNQKIGVISLEESPAETARKLSGLALSRNPSNEEIALDELKVGFDKMFASDNVVLLDHQGAIKDASIIDQLEYMALVGCKYLFIDHITILVSEGAEGLTGNEAIDKIMNDLLRLVKRHNIWIGLVSHLRKTQGGVSFESGKLPSIDDIRGSGSIKQVSFDIIAFARDLGADNEDVRNTIKMSILKSRYTGLTGSVEGCRYDQKTGRLTELSALDESF